MTRIIFILFCVLGAGCAAPTPLEEALQKAGENRHQLEQVLRHFSEEPGDSLKYRAARFLIENMPGHGWYEGKELDEYRQWIDSVYREKDFILKMLLYEAFFQQGGPLDDLEWHEDVRHIDSAFLIAHIDSTFAAIGKRPWIDMLTFEQFCEHILPYRVWNEPPQRLWELQDSVYDSEIAKWMEWDDTRYDGGVFWKNVMKPESVFQRFMKIYYRGTYVDYDLLNCVSLALQDAWRAKILLCPVCWDFTPAYPKQNDRHCWVIAVNTKEPSGFAPLRIEKHSKQGKIYRKTFSRNPIPKSDSSETIPPFFRNPFYRDVTRLYSPVEDVVINPFESVDAANAYLCVFNDLHWEPVAWAARENGVFRYKDVGRDAVYLPVAYLRGVERAVSYPFVLASNGEVYTLKPDTTKMLTLELQRKFPLLSRLRLVNQAFSDAILTASDEPDFRREDTLGVFGDVSALQWVSLDTPSSNGYRYWRIHTGRLFAVAECLLCDENGKRIFPQDAHEGDAAAAFDGDPLSYSYSDKRGSLTMDMGRPVEAVKVECLLRNDGNSVWQGHWYELNYYNGWEWRSLGVKKAEGKTISFSNVPGNALLWLRDLTAGCEERIFTYKDGKVRFW